MSCRVTGSPGSSAGKESTCNVGDLDSILGLEDPLEKEMQPTPVFLPGGYHEQRSLVDYSPRGRRELYTTEQLAYIYIYIYI